MIERACVALKNRFKILDHKPFDHFPIQVKLLLLACCILDNYILGFGIDEFFLNESDVTPDDIDVGHGIPLNDNRVWKNQRQQWTDEMWANGQNLKRKRKK
jgi:hypothetical protein